MATVSVRYIVDDVDAAIAFYCQHLGFEEAMHPAPTLRCWRVAICGWPCPRRVGRAAVVR